MRAKCRLPRAHFVYSLKTIFSSLSSVARCVVCRSPSALLRSLTISLGSLAISFVSLAISFVSFAISFGSLAISFLRVARYLLRVSRYLLPSGRSLSPSFGSLADHCLLCVVRCFISFDVSLLHCIFSSLLWYPLCLACYLFTPSKCTVTKRNGVLPFYCS